MENRRVTMTKRLMKEALLSEMERGVNNPTVTRICALSNINRSTFYAYYPDVNALLKDIEQELLDNLPVYDHKAPTTPEFQKRLEIFFDYVMEHQRLFRVLIVLHEDMEFTQRVIEYTLNRYYVPGEKEPVKCQYAYLFCINGSIAVLRGWIRDHFPVSSQEVASLILQLCDQALLQKITP